MRVVLLLENERVALAAGALGLDRLGWLGREEAEDHCVPQTTKNHAGEAVKAPREKNFATVGPSAAHGKVYFSTRT